MNQMNSYSFMSTLLIDEEIGDEEELTEQEQQYRSLIKLVFEDDDELDVFSLLLMDEMDENKDPIVKNVVHDGPITGTQVIRRMLTSHYRNCFDLCRVMPDIFLKLCSIFRERGMLDDSRHILIEEKMMIFLNIMGMGHRNRSVQHIIKHSGETISKYFSEVLDVVCAWSSEIICPKESFFGTPKHIIEYAGGKYYPFFKDCIGALDGTHIPAFVKKEEANAFRSGRDGKHITQNVLGVCDFHMRFTFVVAGWEGTAHDSKVVNHALYTPEFNFPSPPSEKYYLVDAGYANKKVLF